MKDSGYDLYFGGKEHLPDCLVPARQHFIKYTDDERMELAEKSAEIIRENHDKPYFMVVSLINPHDICPMALNDYNKANGEEVAWEGESWKEESPLVKAMRIPEGMSEDEFYDTVCPPLPDNFAIQKDEPEAIKWLINLRPFKRYAREHYDERRWRLHRWAYCRLTEVVDREIGVILDALKNSGEEDNTLVIFSSDHGDLDAAHTFEHKTAFYEEAANVPFIAMYHGHIKPGTVDDRSLVSNGLDLLPTVCDYAGVPPDASGSWSDPRGKSLRNVFETEGSELRDTLGLESQLGKMVVGNDGLKYLRYDVMGIEERLHDLTRDPGELTHFTDEPDYQDRLKTDMKENWFPEVFNANKSE
jgi:choline-sulfatase